MPGKWGWVDRGKGGVTTKRNSGHKGRAKRVSDVFVSRGLQSS